MGSLTQHADFFEACHNGDVHGVEALARRAPALLKARDRQQGDTGLHAAAERGHEGAVRALLRLGADTSTANDRGLLPQHLAFDEGHTPLSIVLRDHNRARAAGGGGGGGLAAIAASRDPRQPRRVASSTGASHVPEDFEDVATLHDADRPYESVERNLAYTTPAAASPYNNDRRSQRHNASGYDDEPQRRTSVADAPGAAAEAYEIHYFRVSTPGKPDVTLKLRGNEPFEEVAESSGFRDCEPHILQYQNTELPYESTPAEHGFPASSAYQPIPLEQRPLITYMKVFDLSNQRHYVKLAYDHPLSKILNKPELSDYMSQEVVLVWKNEVLDIRHAPGMYNLPCCIDDPPSVRIQHRQPTESASPPSFKAVVDPYA